MSVDVTVDMCHSLPTTSPHHSEWVVVGRGSGGDCEEGVWVLLGGGGGRINSDNVGSGPASKASLRL